MRQKTKLGFGMHKNWWRIFLLLLLGPVAACDAQVKAGSFAKDRASALSGVQEFRRLYAQQNFTGMYKLASPAMKSSITQEQFIAAEESAQTLLGKYLSSTLVATSCFPNEVRLIYHTQFEKQQITEMMVWSVPETTAFLHAYKTSFGYAPVDKKAQVGCPS